MVDTVLLVLIVVVVVVVVVVNVINVVLPAAVRVPPERRTMSNRDRV